MTNLAPPDCSRRRPRGALVAWTGAWLLAIAPPAFAAQPDELADVTAKAEYGYFTEDRPALDHLISAIKGYRDSADPIELYAFAHAEFRRLQLAALAHQLKDAESAGSACLAALDKRSGLVPHDAEGPALAAICAGYLAELGGLKRLTDGHRRDSNLEAARAIAPNNPRVLLAIGVLGRFSTDGGAAQRAASGAALARAAALFDTVSETQPGAPTWGGAEAWLFVGRGLEEDGNLVGARNAYERALLMAPDFAAARRHLKRLSAPR